METAQAKASLARQGAFSALLAALFLFVFKLGVGIAIGSIAVFSESLNSLSDSAAIIVVFLLLKKAAEPADADHPFGHGKFQNLAGLFQTGVIGLGGVWILYSAIKRILYPASISLAGWGMAAMAFSMAITYLVWRRLEKAADRTESVALSATSMEFSMDLFTNGGVIATLALHRYTGAKLLDPVAAIAILGVILYYTQKLARRSLSDLMDESLPDPVKSEIEKVISNNLQHHYPKLVGFHKMRTRRSGFKKLVDLHLLGCKFIPLQEAHALAHGLEDDLRARFPDIEVMIHSEPCYEDCNSCDRLQWE